MNSKTTKDGTKEQGPITRTTTERYDMLQRNGPQTESIIRLMDDERNEKTRDCSCTNNPAEINSVQQGSTWHHDVPVNSAGGGRDGHLFVEPFIGSNHGLNPRNEDASSDEDCESQKQKAVTSESKFIESKFYTVHDYHDHAWEPYAFQPSTKTSLSAAATDGCVQLLSYERSALHEYSRSDIDHCSAPAAEMDIPDYFLGLYAAARRRRTQNFNGQGGSHATSSDQDKNTFPKRLYTMLKMSETENEQRAIVSWQPHGRCFLVHKPQEFVEFILPKYFRQTKFTSFQRQLNLYGFTRLTTGTDRGAYYHEFFLRGRHFLCARIVRIRVKGNGVKPAPSPDTEPDFYRMKPCFEDDIPPPYSGDFKRTSQQHSRESNMSGSATTGNFTSIQHRDASQVLGSLYQASEQRHDMAGEAIMDPSLAMQYSFLPPNVLLAAAATNAQDQRREKLVSFHVSSRNDNEDTFADLMRDVPASFASPTLHANQPSSSLRRTQSDDFVQKKRCANSDCLLPQPNECLEVQQDLSLTSKVRSIQDVINSGRPQVGVKRYRSDSSIIKDRDGKSEDMDPWERETMNTGHAHRSEQDDGDLFDFEAERRDSELDTEIIRMLARGAHMM